MFSKMTPQLMPRLMPRLMPQGERSLLEQCLQLIRVRKKVSSLFLKIVFVSRKFLLCSRFPRFNIYRFVLEGWSRMQPVLRLASALEKQNSQFTDASFEMDEETTLKLFEMLEPPLVEIQFYNYSYFVNDQPNFFQQLMERSTGKLAFNIDGCAGFIFPLIQKYSSKTVEIYCNASYIPEHVSFPSMKLDYMELRKVKTLDHFWNLLNGQRVKRLSVSFADMANIFEEPMIDGPEDAGYFEENSVELPIENSNSSVEQLDLRIDSIFTFPALLQLLSNIEQNFPRLRRLNLKACFFDNNWHICEELDLDLIADWIRKYWSQIQMMKRSVEGLRCEVSCDFYALLLLSHLKVTTDVDCQVEQHPILGTFNFQIDMDSPEYTIGLKAIENNGPFKFTFKVMSSQPH